MRRDHATGRGTLCSVGQDVRWLTHLDAALVRTTTVAKSAGAATRPTLGGHVESITFSGPVATEGHELTGRPFCPACQQRFRGVSGFQYRNNWAHGGRPVELAASSGTFLLVDDVLTHGTTSAACRHVIGSATRRPTVGFFLGKTGGW